MAHRKLSKPDSWFAPPKDGYRSVNLKLDYGNPEIVGEYLPTHKSSGVLENILASADPDGRHRANSIIAPYGSGKSSLLLLLSALLENHEPMRRVLAKVQSQFSSLAPSLAKNFGDFVRKKTAILS